MVETIQAADCIFTLEPYEYCSCDQRRFFIRMHCGSVIFSAKPARKCHHAYNDTARRAASLRWLRRNHKRAANRPHAAQHTLCRSERHVLFWRAIQPYEPPESHGTGIFSRRAFVVVHSASFQRGQGALCGQHCPGKGITQTTVRDRYLGPPHWRLPPVRVFGFTTTAPLRLQTVKPIQRVAVALEPGCPRS